MSRRETISSFLIFVLIILVGSVIWIRFSSIKLGTDSEYEVISSDRTLSDLELDNLNTSLEYWLVSNRDHLHVKVVSSSNIEVKKLYGKVINLSDTLQVLEFDTSSCQSLAENVALFKEAVSVKERHLREFGGWKVELISVDVTELDTVWNNMNTKKDCK